MPARFPAHDIAIPVSAGIGLRTPHLAAVLGAMPAVGWFEVHAENYMGGGALPRHLEAIRRDRPVALHGVGLSVGAIELDSAHLERLAALAARIEPLFVSEHLAWNGTGGTYLNDLLPLPYTAESLARAVRNVDRIQGRLQRRILVENPSTYLRFDVDQMPEGVFVGELARRTGCGVLLDVNNLHVNAVNHGTDGRSAVEALPAGSVEEIHLAGHHVADADGRPILIDDHGGPVAPPVWDLFAAAVARFPTARPLVEWDSNLPPLDVLVAEAIRADENRALVLEGFAHAAAA